MNTPWKHGCALFTTLCLLMLARPADAQPAPDSAARYASRCQDLDAGWTTGGKGGQNPQGTMLWGSALRLGEEETSTVLVTAKVQGAFVPVGRVRSSGGHLASNGSDRAAPPSALIGAILRGTGGDGKPVEVAICTAEPTPDDPDMAWYRIQMWNELTDRWENPCVATKRVLHPRALAVRGTWDATGAHRDSDDEFTFACENGAIAKCATWGYKPWAERNGESLATLHQACTRMARADYCGNGRSHTHEGTIIDMYDALNVIARTTKATKDWTPDHASFEASWGPDGATCLARTRDGRALDQILSECPDRFQKGRTLDLGDGDRCTVVQQNMPRAPGRPLLRNRSYAPATASGGPSNGSR